MASSSAVDPRVTVRFGCDYAKTSNARCHGKSCEKEISQGTLRLSRLIVNPFIPQSSRRGEQLMPVYYHLSCLINYLRSGSEKKKRIADLENDLQGFDQLKKRDQERLKKLFASEEELKEKLTSPASETNYLEHDEEKKFWQISIDQKSTKTKYGLLDEPESNAILLYKDFSSADEAKKYREKKIQERLKHGYTVKKQPAGGRTRKAPPVKRLQTTRKQPQRATKKPSTR